MDVRYGFARAAFNCAEKLASQFLLKRFYSREEFSEPVYPGNLLLCFCEWNGGIAKPDTAGKAFGNPTLRGNHCSLSNFYVTCNANLSSHHDSLADTRAARDTCLRHNYRVFADDHVVRDL